MQSRPTTDSAMSTSQQIKVFPQVMRLKMHQDRRRVEDDPFRMRWSLHSMRSYDICKTMMTTWLPSHSWLTKCKRYIDSCWIRRKCVQRLTHEKKTSREIWRWHYHITERKPGGCGDIQSHMRKYPTWLQQSPSRRRRCGRGEGRASENCCEANSIRNKESGVYPGRGILITSFDPFPDLGFFLEH